MPVTLSVAIGDLTEAGTIGEYVSAVYRWLIPAAAILAIVVLMIGGMQYALARGRPEAISKAKTRMSNALIGLLLVVGAYTIASIIDPNLVTFKELGVPKIRTVVFLDASSTCEFMEENKLIIEPKEGSEEKKCGDKGTVESIPEEAGVTIQEGDPCTYSFCTKTSEKCVSSTLAEKGFDCIRCAESYTTSTGTTNPKGLTPTPTNCARLLHKATEEEKEEEKFFYCEFDAVVFNQCFEIAYPFSASRFFERADSLDCKRLRQDAEVAGSESCRAYDWVKGVYGAFTASGVTANEVDDIIGEKRGDYPLLKKICEEDPCGLAPPGKSCQVFFVSGDEEASIAVGALCTAATFFTGPVALAFGGACALGASAVLSYTGLLSQANCADQDSNYGFFDCTDKNGDPTVCNPYPLLW
ncbi:hypothetical protein IH979_01515 [Patescibacteria group bacterium]|nr:hypothetical protein [Patescibacteria group bacterium]